MQQPSIPSGNPGFWDQRYGEPGWAYGTEPNDFLRSEANRIPLGEVLCLAEGEGRNAVYLAGLGYQVEAIDQSSTGLAKAVALAAQKSVTIRTMQADLVEFDPGRSRWQGIVSIFVHLPAPLRRLIHGRMVQALAPGGLLLLEAYAPAQLAIGTGGPKEPERLCSLDELVVDFEGLEPLISRELQRDIQEGKYHQGNGAVLQFLGRKP